MWLLAVIAIVVGFLSALTHNHWILDPLTWFVLAIALSLLDLPFAPPNFPWRRQSQ